MSKSNDQQREAEIAARLEAYPELIHPVSNADVRWLLTELRRVRSQCTDANYLVGELMADKQILAKRITALEAALVLAGEFVTLLAHGVKWEIAPAIQRQAVDAEATIVRVLATREPTETP